MRIFNKSILVFVVFLSLPQIVDISTEPIASEQVAGSHQPIAED